MRFVSDIKTVKKPDIYSVVGNMCWGERKVKKGGMIKFDGSIYQHEDLKNCTGEKVSVQFVGSNCWATGPIIITDNSGKHICTINKPI